MTSIIAMTSGTGRLPGKQVGAETLLTSAAAAEAIAASIPAFPGEEVALAAATGRILHQAVRAERDQPPFDRVTMDGIAVCHAALDSGRRRFTVQGTQHAGDPVQTLDSDEYCIEIMTGGVLPVNTDCIVPVERITIENNVAVVEPDYHGQRHQFVHARGSDHVRGFEVIARGHRIDPLDVAIIASCGLQCVRVAAQPVIRVISTGNELVPPGQPIESHQVRLSNGPAIVAMLSAQGFAQVAHDHLVDEPALLRERIAAHLEAAGVLLLSGGVSMGKADFVPEVLADLGVTLVFHKISQRPGKPMWFGTGPANQLVFALPGNPVSSLVCCRQYVLPALLNAGGRETPATEFALLDADVTFAPKLTCFLPVRLRSSADGRILATPAPTNTSGDFSALHGTDGYVELALERDEFPAGSPVPLHRWFAP
jgi:molybdopterin molybdotransferase